MWFDKKNRGLFSTCLTHFFMSNAKLWRANNLGKHLFDFSAILQNDELDTSSLVLTQSKTLSRPADVLKNLPKTKVQLSRPDVLTYLPKTKVHWVSDFFDLRWPEQSQTKSSPNYLSGIQTGFCSIFVQYLLDFSPISNDSLLDTIKICLGLLSLL